MKITFICAALVVLISGCSAQRMPTSAVLPTVGEGALLKSGLAFPNGGTFLATYQAPWLGKNGAMTIGPDGNIWVLGLHSIAKVTTSGQMTVYGADDVGDAISSGPGGSIWFSKLDGSVGWISTDGVRHQFTLPNGDSVYALAQGPDRNIWFTDFNHAAIGKIDGFGAVTEYPTPSGQQPSSLIATKAGLWFTEVGYYGLATTSGQITETYIGDLGGLYCDALTMVKYGQGGVWVLLGCYGAECAGEYFQLIPVVDGGPGDACEIGCNFSKAPSSFAPVNPANALWFPFGLNIGDIPLVGNGAGTEQFTHLPPKGYAASVLLGPDKNLWISDTRNRLIYVYNPG
jgi:hypothetical protein